MCVIMVKNKGVHFPEERILQNCWDNNPDMGGFMYAWGGEVHIRKGFMTFESFKQALNKAREKTGDDVPYVLHFRISTQGYDKACCQPFPLSAKMHNLKRSKVTANIGVAHNGVLSLTSDGSKDYSDTMKFITDYLVNIIRGFDWHEDKRTKKLIENLISGSRFAIMDKNGHVEMCGNGWVHDKESGCYFSNSTYSYKKYVWKGNTSSLYGDWDYDDYGEYDPWGRWGNYGSYGYWNKNKKEEKKEEKKTDYFEKEDGLYNFSEDTCPHTVYDDDNYCDHALCKNFHNCSYVKECMNNMCQNVIGFEDTTEDEDVYGLKRDRA